MAALRNYKRKILACFLIIFLFVILSWYASTQHNEAAQWARLNEQVHLGSTTIIINQIDLINYVPLQYGHLGGPFPHLLEYFPRFRDFLNKLMYFYIPCQVKPDSSIITVSAEILFEPQNSILSLDFSMPNCRKIEVENSHYIKGENVVFSRAFTGYTDWNQNSFQLTITDRKTGMQQTIELNPAAWETEHYHYGDLAPPIPPFEYCPVDSILSGFLASFEYNVLSKEKTSLPDWQNYILPAFRNTFPWYSLVPERGGKFLSTDGIPRWEGSGPGFERIYSYTLMHLDSKGNDMLLRQKLFFVRWEDTWRVIDVGPVFEVQNAYE